MSGAIRYVRLMGSLSRYALARELAFRGNFLAKISVEVLWLFILLAFYKTVFAKTSSIAGWSEPQYLFFVGCFFALNGLLETLFLENCNEFAELVRTGDLDFLLLKPIDEQFLISCRKIDWSTGTNVLMGAIVMVLALYQMHWQFSVERHAGSDQFFGMDGSEPKLDGNVVAVFQPRALSQANFQRNLGREHWSLLHVRLADLACGKRTRRSDGEDARLAMDRRHGCGDSACALSQSQVFSEGAAVISQRE
jgi:hypothetical protein